jgi:catenin alpha
VSLVPQLTEGLYFIFAKLFLLLQNRVYMEPSGYRARQHRPELEELLERIVSGAGHIADAEHTREERKKRIIDECNALRQALQDLLTEYERNVRNFPLFI